MIKSMTGYGRAKYENEGREYVIEIKSVNHRYSDISIRIPRTISYLEEKVKKEINACVRRGKVDVFITFNNYSTKGKKININKELASLYIEQLKDLAQITNINSNLHVTEISKFPEVLTIENAEDEDLIWKELQTCLSLAIENFIQMRQNEGKKIFADLKSRILELSEKIEKISILSTGLVEEYVVKLEERIKEILKTDMIDQTRLAQEVVIYADKTSVQEEITRLKSHVSQFLEFLTSDVSGKKLDFLVQEMNRETNTIGSKSGSLEITNLVIDMKTELEDIREQIQNIE